MSCILTLLELARLVEGLLGLLLCVVLGLLRVDPVEPLALDELVDLGGRERCKERLGGVVLESQRVTNSKDMMWGLLTLPTWPCEAWWRSYALVAAKAAALEMSSCDRCDSCCGLDGSALSVFSACCWLKKSERPEV